eukprot:gnl/TRDRNA2_/TRDRNA2_85450_c0_seq1.p1 gnl/TRDRNA2_/TRDRNA2_85450_c0~~gnl/TRDRNA2_/TRDRNA2_85450_c0_seq1.p1  ORF type:complete len:479 (-),score=78.74 gnl/TRDRNA2_/TRDRNA2_85450_c0_seq1:183-1619(-)
MSVDGALLPWTRNATLRGSAAQLATLQRRRPFHSPMCGRNRYVVLLFIVLPAHVALAGGAGHSCGADTDMSCAAAVLDEAVVANGHSLVQKGSHRQESQKHQHQHLGRQKDAAHEDGVETSRSSVTSNSTNELQEQHLQPPQQLQQVLLEPPQSEHAHYIASQLVTLGHRMHKFAHVAFVRTSSWLAHRLSFTAVIVMLLLVFVVIITCAYYRKTAPDAQTRQPQRDPLITRPTVPAPSLRVEYGPQQPRAVPQLDTSTRASAEHKHALSGGLPDDLGHFCPDLVVPPMNECILVVPLNSASLGAFIVSDMSGNAVLRVANQAATASQLKAKADHGSSGVPSSSQKLEITTISGEVLAQCCPVIRALSSVRRDAVGFNLVKANGEYFAQLSYNDEQERYILTLKTGKRLHFWSAGATSEDCAVNITDDEGHLLAATDLCAVDFNPTGKFYRLRVAPNTDVGLVLCGLLCMEYLEGGLS